jgi:hypothetical protein
MTISTSSGAAHRVAVRDVFSFSLDALRLAHRVGPVDDAAKLLDLMCPQSHLHRQTAALMSACNCTLPARLMTTSRPYRLPSIGTTELAPRSTKRRRRQCRQPRRVCPLVKWLERIRVVDPQRRQRHSHIR